MEALAGPAQSGAGPAAVPLDLAEWSYFWIGVEQSHLARGTLTNGKQMYVEYWTPAQVRRPYPIVLVHGGGGQGLDWMGTPDGRPGWVTYLLQEGYKVYVSDAPRRSRTRRPTRQRQDRTGPPRLLSPGPRIRSRRSR